VTATVRNLMVKKDRAVLRNKSNKRHRWTYGTS